MKNKWLDHTVMYGFKLTLCTSEKMYWRQHRKLSKRWPAPHWVSEGHAAMHKYDQKHGSPLIVVCIDDKTRRAVEVAGLLAHEAVHVKQQLMRYVGEAEPSDEFEAYVVQNITQNLLDEYARQKKRR